MQKGIRPAARGFTLLEVMIVIVIILLIGGLVTVNLMGTKKTADRRLAEVQLISLRDALRHFNLEFNRFPTEDEGLVVLWNKEGLSEEDQTKWRKFMDEAVPRDPWGSEWGYRPEPDTAEDADGTGYKLWSNGPDKEEGTADDLFPGNKKPGDGAGGPEDVGPPASGRDK